MNEQRNAIYLPSAKIPLSKYLRSISRQLSLPPVAVFCSFFSLSACAATINKLLTDVQLRGEMDKTCWIGYLDSEQMMNISELLPLQSLLALGMTCRRFRDICYSDRLWESICRREWGNLAVDAMFRCSASLSTSSSSSSSSSSSTSLSSCEGERRKFGGWSWKRVYEQAQQMKCLSCMRLTPKGAAPHPRASHSLNFISDSLVLFGGGCEGGAISLLQSVIIGKVGLANFMVFLAAIAIAFCFLLLDSLIHCRRSWSCFQGSLFLSLLKFSFGKDNGIVPEE